MHLYEDKLLIEAGDICKLTKRQNSSYTAIHRYSINLYKRLCREFSANPYTIYCGLFTGKDDAITAGFSATDHDKKITWIYISIEHLETFGLERMIEDTSVHEVCHSFINTIDAEEGKYNPHGKMWQEIMDYVDSDYGQFFAANNEQISAINLWHQYYHELFGIKDSK